MSDEELMTVCSGHERRVIVESFCTYCGLNMPPPSLAESILAAKGPDGVIRIPMTWEQYMQMGGKSEYIDGCLVWSVE